MLNAEAPVKLLGVRPRTLRQLSAAGIERVADLVESTEHDLGTSGLDPKAIADATECLALNALSLRRPDLDSSATPTVEAVAKTRVASVRLPLGTVDEGEGDVSVPAVEAPVPAKDVADTPDEAAYDDLSDAMFGVHPRKRAKKTDTVTDAKRAANFTTRHTKATSSGPDLTDPDDLARLLALQASPTMDVPDAAWLYGVSRDVIYREAKAGKIACRKFGDRVKIFTEVAFAELFPRGLPEADPR